MNIFIRERNGDLVWEGFNISINKYTKDIFVNYDICIGKQVFSEWTEEFEKALAWERLRDRI